MQKILQDALIAITGFDIPEIPQEVLLLQAELKNKFSTFIQITEIIERNSIISSEVLKLVNSPVMKLRPKTPIRAIIDAVKALGNDNLYNLVVVSSLRKSFPTKGIHEEIMKNSIYIAYCMAEISDYIPDISRDEAYMIGLFHNVGALMLASVNEKQYTKIFSNSLSLPLRVLQREENIFNTNHTIVGVLITKKWQLPLDMINATMQHHVQFCHDIKNDKVRTMVAMLKIANAIVAEIALGAYYGEEMFRYEKDGVKTLMLKDKDVKAIRSKLMSYTVK